MSFLQQEKKRKKQVCLHAQCLFLVNGSSKTDPRGPGLDSQCLTVLTGSTGPASDREIGSCANTTYSVLSPANQDQRSDTPEAGTGVCTEYGAQSTGVGRSMSRLVLVAALAAARVKIQC